WFVLPLFVVLRFVAKVAGGGLASRVGGGVIPPKTGWALVSQGGLSVCLVIEFLLLVPGPTSQLIFDVALLAALINEVLGARAFAIGFPPPARSMAPPAPEANCGNSALPRLILIVGLLAGVDALQRARGETGTPVALAAGGLLLAALFAGKVATFLHLPRLTGYLLVGVGVGPYALGFIPKEGITGLAL